ncbi:tRNA lysidine(34) synthetase TilS [Nocardioides marmoribigeumensis]|uniref:tRNA(Ile)-lysidine synthase n=1 Tax=Nocardioides marmoribigeumensis TaxID=433649 RepID=A0ABU2BT04_9ACTN|nr:tRNA lysidine(34) synthetase TilS [Nocardioides marmoribigeumensis]MDR7361763.1 tRNA(Ile)-lysidine synthase [Nocardioides marmoribigeumensis]
MTGPDPAVAAVRLAVRRVVGDAGTVLVACSGGADSLALLAATVFETRRTATRVVGAVVDHGLQDGSAEHTARVVRQMADLGADETASIRVTVDPGPGGIEAGAREARYAALDRLARHFAAGTVLLGHTVDDQAESVLLGLTQGSGPRSLAGMRDGFRDGADGPLFVRPFLREVTRPQTEAACRAEAIEPWEDPHNLDQRFLRARVRHVVMPLLEAELGPGVARALARTGHLLREDVEALDDEAQAQQQRHDLGVGVAVEDLRGLTRAVRTRVLRLAALAAGAPARDLTYGHVQALDAMVEDPRGEPRDLDLPGHVRAERRGDVLRLVDSRPDLPGPVAG